MKNKRIPSTYSDLLLQSLLDNLHMGVIWIRANGDIVDLNIKAMQILDIETASTDKAIWDYIYLGQSNRGTPQTYDNLHDLDGEFLTRNSDGANRIRVELHHIDNLAEHLLFIEEVTPTLEFDNPIEEDGTDAEAQLERERQRIARELHDSVTQTIFAANTMVEILPHVLESNPEKAKQYIGELGQLTRGAMAELRALMVELKPELIAQTEIGNLITATL